jgi:hypothetical protein
MHADSQQRKPARLLTTPLRLDTKIGSVEGVRVGVPA